MTPLVIFEVHGDFASATVRAHALAKQFFIEILVEHYNDEWRLILSYDVYSRLNNELSRCNNSDENSDFDDIYHEKEVIAEPDSDDYECCDADIWLDEEDDTIIYIRREMNEDMESYARSNEDGWFYSD